MILGMGLRERPADRGRRLGRERLAEALRDFRNARLERSLTQATIGRALGRSDAWVSWTESGGNTTLAIQDLAAMLACVGLRLSLRAYPDGGGLRDRAQLELLAAFRQLVGPHWAWATEVPIPIPGDLRAWDVGLTASGCRIGVDAETRIHDAQAVDRRVMLKLRDSGLDRAIILVAATRTNRDVLRQLNGAIAANFPIPSRAALAALRAGRDPGGNAIVMLDTRPSRRNARPGDRPSSLIGMSEPSRHR